MLYVQLIFADSWGRTRWIIYRKLISFRSFNCMTKMKMATWTMMIFCSLCCLMMTSSSEPRLRRGPHTCPKVVSSRPMLSLSSQEWLRKRSTSILRSKKRRRRSSGNLISTPEHAFKLWTPRASGTLILINWTTFIKSSTLQAINKK